MTNNNDGAASCVGTSSTINHKIIGRVVLTAFKCIAATDPYLIYLECLNRNNVFVLVCVFFFAMREIFSWE